MNTEEPDRQPDEAPDLNALRDRHIGRLFLRAHRAFASRSIAKLRARGHDRLTLAHTAMLPHLDLTGTSITVLAERAGMTKQSMGQLVADLERSGYVARMSNPNDKRAAVVIFTDRGWEFVRDAHEVKLEVRGEYVDLLGQERFDALEASLDVLANATPPDLKAAVAQDPFKTG